MEDTVVFLDGAYLSLITKHFGERGNYLSVDIHQFAITIAKNQGLWCREVYYYTSPPFQAEPPTVDEKERRRKYDKFVSQLQRIPGLTVREGRCQKLDDGYHQKGVDTLLTMDLLSLCSTKDIRTIIILTSDTDFVPLLNEIRKKGIRVILYYYNDFIRGSKFSMSNHLLTACDSGILITKEMLLRSIKRPV